MSGVVMDLVPSDNEMRYIFTDCGGAVAIRDYVLNNCGGFKKGDRVTVSISSCEVDEYHYPPRPVD